MTRRTVLIAVVVLITIGIAGYAAHNFDIVASARSLHGG